MSNRIVALSELQSLTLGSGWTRVEYEVEHDGGVTKFNDIHEARKFAGRHRFRGRQSIVAIVH